MHHEYGRLTLATAGLLLLYILTVVNELEIVFCSLLSLLAWKLISYGSDDQLEISFLEGTLVLQVNFGSTVEGCLFAGQPARLVTDLTLTSHMQGTFSLLRINFCFGL